MNHFGTVRKFLKSFGGHAMKNAALGILIPFFGTALGSACVLLMKKKMRGIAKTVG